MTEKARMTEALKGTLRLLTFFRELLKVQQSENTPMFNAVKTHADLCALALPDKHRVSAVEMIAMVKAARFAAGLAAVELPQRGEMIILDPAKLKLNPGETVILDGAGSPIA